MMIAAFLSGLLFGIGLLLAGMADPAKVLAFLDLAGAWDAFADAGYGRRHRRCRTGLCLGTQTAAHAAG